MGGTAPPSALPGISPARGEIGARLLSPIFIVAGTAPAAKLLISPLAGEMAGRPEGGVKELDI
ncbi:MAG: propionyl-coenzyme A carboxylase alpha polypeptide [Mesorhizobium sp.]|nr:propionyl-coenzyme A carboxylase alpha polypeptide [Mesorhizobium sp. M1E.F.Ca.ET.041.01.1.1]RWD82265.1 MAG: propionyl-coenzyme A carboxylase alpha polypeptide [Mesorhizobium sp.]